MRDTHGKDPERLQRELLELHRREGVSPVAGCLPSLIQLPVIMVAYRLCAAPTVGGAPNVLLEHSLAGVPLTAHLATAGSGLPVFLCVLAVSVLLAYLTMRQTRSYLVAPPAGGDTGQAEVAVMMQRIMPMISFGSVLAVAVLPLGAGLYLITSATWTLGERYAVRRLVTV